MEARSKHKHSRAGLTLLEVVVLVAFLFLLASILISAITGSTAHPPGLRLSTNAGGIYRQIFAAATENIGGSVNYWAASVPDTEFANYEPTSTEYFRWLMTPYDIKNPANGAEVLQQDFSSFAAPGFSGISTLEELTPETNPWVVVADLTESSASGTPFLMTRNVNETHLKDWRPEEGQALKNVGTGTYATPYGDEQLIVVRVGGGSEVLNRKQFFWDLLNPQSFTNLVLQP